MMTQLNYNSYTHPPHMKLKQTQSSISQMITQNQSSASLIQISEGLVSIKPWYFKPKKILYRVEDDQMIKKKKKFNSLHWSQQENFRYAQFLAKYSSLVQGEVLEKRKFHLNRMMSKHVKTRSPVQCRSHHQKMVQSFKSIECIVEYFQSKQLPVYTSTNLLDERHSKADQNNQSSEVIQKSIQVKDNERHYLQDYRQHFFQESFDRILDDILGPVDAVSQLRNYPMPQLDSNQI